MKKVAIFGAGIFGAEMFLYIQECYQVVCFIDNNPEKWGKSHHGLDVCDPKVLPQLKVDIVFIAMKDRISIEKIIHQLQAHNSINIYYCPVSHFYYRKSKKRCDDTFINECVRCDSLSLPLLSYCEVHAAHQCNLNCAGCTHYASLLPMDMPFPDIEVFRRDVARLAELFTNIILFRIMGGEPLLNPGLSLFIQYAREAFPKTDLRIITNGVLLPKMSTDLIETIRKNEVTMDISAYPPVHNALAAGLAFLEEVGIPYEVSAENNDFFVPLVETPDEDHYQQGCSSIQCTNVLAGRIARCPQVLYLSWLNKTFDTKLPQDGVYDLYAPGITGEELIRLLAKPVALCRHCVTVKSAWRACRTPEKGMWFADTSIRER